MSADSAAEGSSAQQQLLERHPRATWRARDSAIALFWLEIHDEFRRECVALTLAGDEHRAGRIAPRQLAASAGLRLRGLVGHLRGHHEIEDHHYFPTLRDADRRFAEDFDRLAADHAALERQVDAALAALANLVAAASAESDETAAVRHAAERYVRESESLCRRLVRHLGDEEDLVIPLLIERGA